MSSKRLESTENLGQNFRGYLDSYSNLLLPVFITAYRTADESSYKTSLENLVEEGGKIEVLNTSTKYEKNKAKTFTFSFGTFFKFYEESKEESLKEPFDKLDTKLIEDFVQVLKEEREEVLLDYLAESNFKQKENLREIQKKLRNNKVIYPRDSPQT